MSNKGNNTDEIKSNSSDGLAIPYVVRFWIYLLFEIPSIICSIFVLSHLLFNRRLRNALSNHIIIILLFMNLIVQLTEIPWFISYYRLGSVWLATPTFCLVWVFIDESLSVTITIFFAWATIERHILIFHDQWVSTRTKRIFIHFSPIGFLSLYCICYSFVAIIFPPCENVFDYTLPVCGYPLCYYETPVLNVWDVVVNNLMPTVVIILSSVTLLGRILYQKYRVRQPIRWRRHRKMAIQLSSVTVLYLTLYIPEMLMEFVHLCGVSEDIGGEFILYAQFFSYYVNLLFPFVCAGTLPNLKDKIKNILPCWRRPIRVIAPEVFHRSQKPDGRFVREPIIVR